MHGLTVFFFVCLFLGGGLLGLTWSGKVKSE